VPQGKPLRDRRGGPGEILIVNHCPYRNIIRVVIDGEGV
jgi:hypothetical protein